MTSTQNPNRLQTQLAHMIALEAAIEQRIEELIPEVSDHAEATALLTGFQTLSKDQRQALETRLHTIADNAPQMKDPATGFAANGLSEGRNYPVSTALQIIYTMFNQDVILAAAGKEIESFGDLQSAVKKGEPGEEIRLKVRRGSDELEEVDVVHP